MKSVVSALLIAMAATPLAAAPVFPLKTSADNRLLVDQNDTPFLMIGDAPQAMVGNLSVAQAKFFMDNRAQYGINALWVNLLCDSYTACNADGTTFDGIAPFTTPGDLSTPNPTYFARAEKMLQAAAARDMVVLLDPIETGGWLSVLQSNGPVKARKYGEFLGKRFKDQPNIIWMSGNDFQTWRNSSDNDLVRAVMRGIAAADPNHIQTIELDYYVSASLDDKALRPLLGLDAVYTYRPTYAEELAEYKRASYRPTFLVEANYEFEHNGGTDGGTTQNLRRQEYWTALSGTTGQLYGSAYSWRLQGDWQDNLDTVGILQLSYVKQLFESRAWYNLVPDYLHQVLIKGYGKFSKSDPIPDDTYATAARTADGNLVMAYLPSPRTVTIDMTQLAGTATVHWFDPTNASFGDVGSFPNSGTQRFTPPGNNAAGDGDWVLVIETQ
ncbi:MAG: DUF4038 domain-containing protein [Alphaproteobacteria bacterium]|nr:DUF4038 domain-containing protein [Alphaproteobacteria bacterium]MBV9695067.1 DUF4038 domain-containing protein [Alphaproteobacteria bacterium]